MIFFTGFVLGIGAGCGALWWYYREKCADRQVQTDSREKDREIQKQLERLISYGNDF